MDLKELESGVDPTKDWYYQSKKKPLVAFVKKIYRQKKAPLTIIDVGSGSGFFMYELDKLIPEMISKMVLVDIGYSDDEIASTRGKRIEKKLQLPDSIENAVVVMMDVLEHLPDDLAMLMNIKTASKSENHFFITVPAFKSLWSGHDIYLGHYRRYTLTSLKNLLTRAHLTGVKGYYIYGLIFPLVWLKRKFVRSAATPKSDMKPSGAIINGFLKTICFMEMNFRKMNRIAGVTCVCEGRI